MEAQRDKFFRNTIINFVLHTTELFTQKSLPQPFSSQPISLRLRGAAQRLDPRPRRCHFLGSTVHRAVVGVRRAPTRPHLGHVARGEGGKSTGYQQQEGGWPLGGPGGRGVL